MKIETQWKSTHPILTPPRGKTNRFREDKFDLSLENGMGSNENGGDSGPNPGPIRAQGRPFHSAARSSGVSVSRGAAAASEASASSAPPIEPVWSGDFLSVMM